jgi:16S rRNA (cytidine1402-2'-O)-methyltransferase
VTGTLYLVATPIGNLADITLRAIEILRQSDFIACEDTRHSGRLLAHLGIEKPLVRCDDVLEKRIAPRLAERIVAGETAALISDAGTPAISDPGYALLQAAIAQGIPVVPIPGPSAVIAALCASGLPTHAFRFEGYLPEKSGARKKRLAQLASDDATHVLFVPPHKLRRWLPDLIEVWGDRRACLARELTKKFEQFQRGRLSELLDAYREKTPKGEMVLLVAGVEK